MKYEENPIALLLIPLALILGGGAVAAAVVLKKKPPPAPPAPPGYPFAEQPGMVPSGMQRPPSDPLKQIKQFEQKYGTMLPSAADAAKQAWGLVIGEKPPAAPFVETPEIPPSEPMPGFEEPEVEQTVSPATKAPLEAAKKAGAGILTTQVAGVGLGTVLLVGAGIAVAVAAFEGYRSHQKQLKKLHKDYKLWRAMAVQYDNQRKDVEKNIKVLEKERRRMLAGIPKLRAALARIG